MSTEFFEGWFDLPEESATQRLAARLAEAIHPPLVLTFQGEIGAGKTTFIRALLRQLGVTYAIKSPTFSLVESYDCAGFAVHHFVLYRIVDESELDFIGFRDYFSSKDLCCIEWPERAPALMNQVDLDFRLDIKAVGRCLRASAKTQAGLLLLDQILKDEHEAKD